MRDQHANGLVLSGFSSVHTQEDAATLGLSLLEELPSTRVEPHYASYRLFFGDHPVDFPQAVALMYYLFTIHMGVTMAGMGSPKDARDLRVLMDRFPGASPENGKPGAPLTKTDGFHLLEYTEANSTTSQGIAEKNAEKGITMEFDTLDWWTDPDGSVARGKTHPHFALPDWLAAATMATEFPDDYVDTFTHRDYAPDAIIALQDLHAAFKQFDLWTLAEGASHLKGSEVLWEIPDEARAFIFERATTKKT